MKAFRLPHRNRMRDPASRRGTGFTIIEVLVACVVLVLMLGIVLAIVGQAGEVWRRSNSRLEVYKGARNAFNNLNRLLSQATLNTYWDYDDPNSPGHYIRRSELHFTTGPALDVLGQADRYVGQGIFFQAPVNLGASDYRGVDGLLSACGFYIEYGSNSAWIPEHVRSVNPPTERFRLFQWVQPTENLAVYRATGAGWIDPSLATGAYPVADNVVALIIWPAQENGQATSLNSYHYDTRYQAGFYPQPVTANQLPPMLQVTMVAIDEASAMRLGSGLRTAIEGALDGLFSDNPATKFQTDLETLESRLVEAKVDYRVFHSSIPMKEAKWSSQ